MRAISLPFQRRLLYASPLWKRTANSTNVCLISGNLSWHLIETRDWSAQELQEFL